MTPTEAQKKARHTEGPWRKIGRAIVDQHGRVEIAVASTGDTGDTHVNENHRVEKGEAFANATLIASAPDMLLALRELLAIGEGGVIQRNETGKPTWSALDEIKRIAGAAIAKAEGVAQ